MIFRVLSSNMQQLHNCRAKRALTGEVNEKLRIAALGRMWHSERNDRELNGKLLEHSFDATYHVRVTFTVLLYKTNGSLRSFRLF